MHTLGMPSDGWVVSPGQLKCDSLYWWKHGMCPDVIDACAADGVQCPGIMPRPRRFVTNARRQRPPVRRTNAVRRVQFPTADEASDTETIESSQASSCLMTTEENDTPDNSPTPTTSEVSLASARVSDLGESFGAFHPLLNERPNGPSTHEASVRRELTSSISNGHQADLHDARLSQLIPPTTCVASTSSIQSSTPAAQVPRPIYQVEHGESSTDTEADSQDAVLALVLDQPQDVRGSTTERVVDEEHSPLV
ncbi:hypothetical protein GN244_ATG11059 [Phytophthora infestans]|uniref:Uncharacterized protein n=1 Tax=Phytophthora infestans TaxID=4787 RepID=A0A833SQU1_PHYIN|nr:hypothetical protein GN244_ATG11059 [Phytophthora infestans]